MDRETFVALAFVTLVGIKEHPRNSAGADVEACFALAEKMYATYERGCGSGDRRDRVARRRDDGQLGPAGDQYGPGRPRAR